MIRQDEISDLMDNQVNLLQEPTQQESEDFDSVDEVEYSLSFNTSIDHEKHENSSIPLSGLTVRESILFSSSISLSRIIGTCGNFINMSILSGIDKNNLAAGGLISTSQTLIINTSSAVLYSIASITGKEHGSQKLLLMNPLLINGFVLSIFLSGPSIILALCDGRISKLIGEPSELTDIVQDYFYGYSWGIPAILMLRAQQQFSLGTLNVSPVNIVVFVNTALASTLGYIIIHGELNAPKLGAAGLGHAISLSNWICLISFTLYLKHSSRFEKYSLQFATKAIMMNVFKKILYLGIPISVQIGSELLGLVTSTAIIGSLGTNALSSHQIGAQYAFLTIIPIFAINQATSIIVGHARGRGDLVEAKRLGHACIGFSAGLSIIVLVGFSCFPKMLASAFINVNDSANSEIIENVSLILKINGVGQIFDAIRIVSAGAIQGVFEEASFAMKAGVISMCVVALPLGYVLAISAGLGVSGIYYARGIGMFLGGAAMLNHWYKRINLLLTSVDKERAEKEGIQSSFDGNNFEKTPKSILFNYSKEKKHENTSTISSPLLPRDEAEEKKKCCRCSIL